MISNIRNQTPQQQSRASDGCPALLFVRGNQKEEHEKEGSDGTLAVQRCFIKDVIPTPASRPDRERGRRDLVLIGDPRLDLELQFAGRLPDGLGRFPGLDPQMVWHGYPAFHRPSRPTVL